MADVRRSKRLSFWLRHAPQEGGLSLDHAGWTSTEALLKALAATGLPTSLQELEKLVLTNDKQRFELSGDKQKMRARQGHSVAVEADWPITEPPDVLYHGTGAKVLGPIFQEGLLRGKRHHVHLSQTVDQAASVGRRRGTPTVIEVDARGMSREGFVFRRSSNDVWLADHVPPRFLRLLA